MLVFPEGVEKIQEASGKFSKIENTGGFVLLNPWC